MSFEKIQPTDADETDLAVERTVAKKIRDRRREKDLEAEAHVRALIGIADDALAGTVTVEPERVLKELHYALRLDGGLPRALRVGSDVPQLYRILFMAHAEIRNRGEHPPPLQELKTACSIAKSLGYLSAYGDRTRYAPVGVEPVSGSKVSTTDDVTPIGRRRIGARESVELESRAVWIDHSDAEHIIIIALPRKGKDSTGCRIIGNLVTEHSYKAWSLFDDGRNETNMWGIPADEPTIQEIIEEDFEQEPTAYDTNILIPATPGIPDELPGNFTPFTIGLGDLTPRVIMQLASVDAKNVETERRLGMALRETIQENGTVEALVTRIEEYAEESELQISVTEVRDDDGEDGAETETVSYQMSEDKYLREIAKSLAMLGGEGLIGNVNQDSNIDLVSEFQAQERVAVLNCNYLDSTNRYLKFVLINALISLIWNLKDDDTLRLPRAVLELRELKNLAPSQTQHTNYSKIKQALTKTLYKVASQGGSRRVLMVGSTQKLNGVAKAIRQNMPTKILLQLNQEEIKTLNKSHNFSKQERYQLERFKQGWGMLIHDGRKTYPIQWCPALNGMGLGDDNWQDRYGRAMGARTLAYDGEPADAWLALDGTLYTEPDTLGEFQWYLTPNDVETPLLDLADMSKQERAAVVQHALEARRRHPLPHELHRKESGVSGTQRSITLRSAEEAKGDKWQDVMEEYEIPPPLAGWGQVGDEKRENMILVLETIETHDVETYKEAANLSGLGKSTIANYMRRDTELGTCVEGTGRGNEFELTPVGRQALSVPWDELEIR